VALDKTARTQLLSGNRTVLTKLGAEALDDLMPEVLRRRRQPKQNACSLMRLTHLSVFTLLCRKRVLNYAEAVFAERSNGSDKVGCPTLTLGVDDLFQKGCISVFLCHNLLGK